MNPRNMLTPQDKFVDKLPVYFPQAYPQAQYPNQHLLAHIHLVNPYPR